MGLRDRAYPFFGFIMNNKNKLKLVILISGRGSNMRSIVEAANNGAIPAQILAVISNRADAQGLEYAAKQGIATETLSHKDFETRNDFDAALHDLIAEYNPDLICLAGFMRILGADFVAKWPNKILNIHPSLLPAYKGLNTHARAIENGETQSGCTVHYVTPELDSGDIVIQKSVPVHTDDTPETLAARVLEQEHSAYPEAIAEIAGKQSV